MHAIDWNEPVWLKAMVYGKSGSGKTSIGVSAPRPLILLNQVQALVHIKEAAKRLGKPTPPVLIMSSMADYRAVLKALRAPKDKPFQVIAEPPRDADGNITGPPRVVLELPEWPATVVLDDVTDAAEIITAEIRRESPPQLGKDGLPVDSDRFWNELRKRFLAFTRAFRDVPLHTLFLALLDHRPAREDDPDSKDWTGPMVPMRAFPGMLMASVAAVGVAYRKRVVSKDKDGKPVVSFHWAVATQASEAYEIKPHPALRPYEVPDFSSWVMRIVDPDAPAPPAPPPMDTASVMLDESKPETKPEQTKNDAEMKGDSDGDVRSEGA